MRLRRKIALLTTAVVVPGVVVGVVYATSASAHGAMMAPGSRTYLCWKDGLSAQGDIQPQNPACAAAAAKSGTTAFYNWFAVLRSDGAGRTRGFIPDGELCSAGATVYDFSGFDLPRDDWPVTHLTSDASFDFSYNDWAKHPGTFSMYVTNDTYDPTKPLTWDEMESTPFLSVTDPPSIGGPGTADGHYYWTGNLPSGKSGRHIIYSVWARSDSTETFYGCSDVDFDGGNGEVTGIGASTTGTPTATAASTAPATTAPGTTAPATTAAVTTAPATTAAVTTAPATTAAVTTAPATTTPAVTSPEVTSDSASTSASAMPDAGCMATYAITSMWSGGFTVTVSVMNHSSGPLNGWKVGWTFDNAQTITTLWNGSYTQSGSSVTVTNAPWNGTVAVDGTTTFGFLGTFPATNSLPTLTCTAI